MTAKIWARPVRAQREKYTNRIQIGPDHQNKTVRDNPLDQALVPAIFPFEVPDRMRLSRFHTIVWGTDSGPGAKVGFAIYRFRNAWQGRAADGGYTDFVSGAKQGYLNYKPVFELVRALPPTIAALAGNTNSLQYNYDFAPELVLSYEGGPYAVMVAVDIAGLNWAYDVALSNNQRTTYYADYTMSDLEDWPKNLSIMNSSTSGTNGSPSITLLSATGVRLYPPTTDVESGVW